MKTEFPSEGILVALSIPTDARRRVLTRALNGHLQWLRDRGVRGVLALGSSGEFMRLDVDERKAVLEAVAEIAAPLPVIANISDVRPRVVSELGRCARQLGVAGVAIMPPSFYRVSAADQLAFFLHAAEAAKLPAMLYNFPELTGNRIGAETIAAFADRAPLAAIKQSGAEFGYHEELVALGHEKKFVVFSGADTRLPEVFKLGAVGCIGGMVNFVPEYMVELFNICRLGRAGDPGPAAARMKEVGAIVNRLTFPLSVAAGVQARGIEPGDPKTVIAGETAALYREVVATLRARFAEWELEPLGAPKRTGRSAAVVS